MAVKLAERIGGSVAFQIGDRPDLRLESGTLQFTVEVEHKSSAVTPSDALSPDPAQMEEYRKSVNPYQRAIERLRSVLALLPIDVAPIIGAELARPQWGGNERRLKELQWAELLTWLADQLSALRVVPCVLNGPFDSTFEVTGLEGLPGHFSGHLTRIFEVANASLCKWLKLALHRKASIERRSAASGCIIGLVIDEALACNGYELLATLFGPSTYESWTGRSYRPVPENHRGDLERARNAGFLDLLTTVQSDEHETPRGPDEQGFFFEEGSDQVQGVLALYYTGKLQYLPNPFAGAPNHALHALFPPSVKPS